MPSLQTRLRRRFQFYVGAEELPALEDLVRRHGSVQEAVLAALRALHGATSEGGSGAPDEPPAAPEPASSPREQLPPDTADTKAIRGAVVQLYAADAAAVLGTTAEGVRSRIRRGTLSAHQDEHGYWVVDVDRDRVRDSGVELSARGAALLVGRRPGTIKKWCKEGRYPSAHNDGGGWLIPVADVLT